MLHEHNITIFMKTFIELIIKQVLMLYGYREETRTKIQREQGVSNF